MEPLEPTKTNYVPLVYGLNWDYRSGEGIPTFSLDDPYWLWKCPTCSTYNEFRFMNKELDAPDGTRRVAVCKKCLKAVIMEVYDYPRTHDVPIPYDEPQFNDLQDHFESVHGYLPYSALLMAAEGEWDGIADFLIWLTKNKRDRYQVRLHRGDVEGGVAFGVEAKQFRAESDSTLFEAAFLEDATKDGESFNDVVFKGYCGTNSNNDKLSITIHYRDEDDKPHSKTRRYTGTTFHKKD
jgi:hypothetical protein